jgi:hypothetical protein
MLDKHLITVLRTYSNFWQAANRTSAFHSRNSKILAHEFDTNFRLPDSEPPARARDSTGLIDDFPDRVHRPQKFRNT